ncbi:permease [Methylacidiphilum kamchatkense Kam1]|uniref:Permease n=1 Tax=Methylacidiphilum kamchatkense Kam1 TaxID=1202785 RepID=A0ABR4ZXW9_9BACT|nr:general stress protein [Methylacidiphilum kamchatkense]KIE58581.1 permease [Methylacidiphilum kamchatkense Kam1]
MPDISLSAVYHSLEDAEKALKSLEQNQFPLTRVSILAQDLSSERKVHGYVTAGDIAKTGATIGGWVGGLFGILVGAAFVWVPGFGPLIVAGPLSAALLGGLEGLVAGGVAGAALGFLSGLGIEKKHILKFEEHLKAGKYLLVIRGTEEEIERAKKIIEATQPLEMQVHKENP